MTRAGWGVLVLLGGMGVVSTGCASTNADEWRNRYLEEERAKTSIAGRLSDAQAARQTAVVQLEEARQRIGELETEVDALQGALASAQTAPAPVAEDSSVADTLDDLARKGMNGYETADGNIAIVLPADITFGSGKKDLTTVGRKAVDAVAAELKGQFAGYTVRIEGHTDTDPIKRSKFDDNWELGAERSLSVLRHLAEKHGIAPERLMAATRGQTQPVADNKSKDGKAQNRRVEVVVVVPRGAAAAE